MFGLTCSLTLLGAAFTGTAARHDRVLLHFGHDANPTTVHAVGTLGAAANRIATALADAGGSMDILVELAPGSHRVPAGGLRLSAEHTPSSTRHTVTWRCADGPGSCSVHGGQAVSSGWKPASSTCGRNECISSVETFVPPAVVRSSRLLLSACWRSLPPWRRAVGSRLPPRVSCLSAGSEREARPKPHSFHTDGHQHFATFMY